MPSNPVRWHANIGPMEIIRLLLVALLLFGAKRLPEIGRSLGSGMREFKDSVTRQSPTPTQRRELPVRTQDMRRPRRARVCSENEPVQN